MRPEDEDGGEAPGITLVGVNLPQEKVRAKLAKDLCFGKRFAKSVAECRGCRAPVVVGDRLHLMRELCEAETLGASSPTTLRVLTAREVADRIESGRTVEEIFVEVLGDSDPSVAAGAARQLLANRLRYIEKEQQLPVPELPTTGALLNTCGVSK